MTQATNFGGLPWNVEECLSSWCEITVIHQDKVGFKQETGWSRCKGMFFLPNIMQLVQGKILLVKSLGQILQKYITWAVFKAPRRPFKKLLG